MAVTHSTAFRVDVANLKSGQSTTFNAGSANKLILFTGTPPANAATALSGNTAAATLTSLVYGTPNGSTGVMSLTGTQDSNAVGGVVTFYRITKSDGTTAIEQGSAGTSGTDLVISSTTIAAGAAVSFTGSSTYTPCP
jgi:hypothetical protein